MSSDKIKELLKLITKYDKSYYDDNVSLVSDEEYDKLKREYNALIDSEYKSLDLFAGVAVKSVGYAPNQRFKIVRHQVPMLSLDNVTNEEEFLDYLKKIRRFFNLKEDEKILFTCELKIDGLSFSARYEKGKLVHVLTRGDGVEGEDVTANVRQIDGFPAEIDLQDDVFEVRGEIYFSKQDFFNLNDKLEEKEKFSNPRNAASGTLRNLDTSLAKERNLKYFAYTFGQIDKKNLNIKSQFDFLQFIKKLKFNVTEDVVCTNSLLDVQNYYNKILENRYRIPFDIDGIVVKIDNLDLQERMGSTNHSQRWAIAYKFPAQEVKTKIIDVVHQVGRTGTLTPVAILEPVNAGGVLIKKATMHNYDDVEKKNLSIGSLVYIKRAGDVIPYIVKDCSQELNVEERRCLQKIYIPAVCPSCGVDTAIDRTSNVTTVKCVNKFACKEQIVQSFFHFASRDAMNIKGLGEKIILRFFELGFLKNFSDLWNLKAFKDKII
jgi:DNA ligase (NAD+)